jgi:hypothetical protein
MTRTKRALAALATSGTLALAPAVPAMAQGPVVTGGLVNVTVTNLLNNDTILSQNNVGVGVAAQVAANVCGVSVGVLASAIGQGAPVDCTNPTGDTGVTITRLTQ